MAPRQLPSFQDLVAAVVTAVVALGTAVALREAGVLERIDLAMHDRLVRSVAGTGSDEGIVVVLESEADLARWGFPLSDEVLAALLDRILAARPLAVAVDKYRDRPVEPGGARLAALLARADRIVWVEKFGADASEGVLAPAALDRRFVGCGDVVEDPDGTVRRALLYLDRGDAVCYTLAFQLARIAAASRGLEIAFPPDPPARARMGSGTFHAIDPGDGPYALADTAGFQVAIPTAAGLPRMKTIAMTDLLEGRVPAGDLAGRLVLFGSRAESLRDFFAIPGIEGTVAGVEVHALFASHLLRAAAGTARALRLAPGHWSYTLAAVLAAIAATIGCLRLRPWVVLLAGLAMAITYAAAMGGLAAGGIFFALSAPALALTLALAIGITRTAWLEHRERARLMQIFRRHVSSEVAEELWRRRDEFFAGDMFVPRTMEATVLFLDIRGFTTIMERLPPQRAVPWLNRGLGAMTEAIMRNGGVVTRFSGDAIMAAFGAPVPRTGGDELRADAAHAIEAALDIASTLARLNAQSERDGLPPIRVRIGINSGPMMQCSVGTAQRMEFTLLGDSVNTAARLESHPMDDDGAIVRILIGERTLELAGERFAAFPVGSMALKGKELPVSIHRVPWPR